jgi:hypothetical protein
MSAIETRDITHLSTLLLPNHTTIVSLNMIFTVECSVKIFRLCKIQLIANEKRVVER